MLNGERDLFYFLLMKRLSNHGTYFSKYVFPYLVLAILVGITIEAVISEFYLTLFIFYPIFLFIIITTKFFYPQRRLCKVYIDVDSQQLGINDFKSNYTLPFTQLRLVKGMERNKVIKMVFKDRTIYFMPPGEFNLLINNRELIKFLNDIIKKGSRVSSQSAADR